MQYVPGNILYITPYHGKFETKPKYFIILSVIDDSAIVANLPTSKDHIPSQLEKRHGCINSEEMQVNCYYFEQGKIVSECGSFSFPLNTYLYGEHVELLECANLDVRYSIEGEHYKKLCRLSDDEFQELKKCLSLSKKVKNKIKKHLL